MTTERDDLARSVWIADNHNAENAAYLWDKEGPDHNGYAYRIADGLIREGYTKPPAIAKDRMEAAISAAYVSASRHLGLPHHTRGERHWGDEDFIRASEEDLQRNKAALRPVVEAIIAAWDGAPDTLKAAITHLEEHRDKGTTCPCCGQRVRVYRRTINARMVQTLAAIYRAAVEAEPWSPTRAYIHVPSLGVDRNHEVAQLGWRGLVEEASGQREDGGRAGYWRITVLGLGWLQGSCDVPRTVSVYNGQIQGLSEDRVKITDVAGEGFNLQDLLDRTTP